MLEKVDNERLSVFAIWMPVLRTDSSRAAAKAAPLLTDARVTHYWDDHQSLGKLYGKTLSLPRDNDLAWDVYFVYAPGVEWTDQLPMPTEWMHQLDRDARQFSGKKLRASIVDLLPESP